MDSVSDNKHAAMKASRFTDAMAFWYALINYEVKAASADDLKLDRMRQLLNALGNPHERLRFVHVAGSKGKGSVCAMLASVLQLGGYKTGLFTSPHLLHIEERIQINRVPIESEVLAGILIEIRDTIATQSLPRPTFFEVATAAAFLYFVRCAVDIVVLEVGLGGRLDSTNVVDPEVAVITSISLDHVHQLGSTLAAIAGEKAGIVKPHRPVVSGVTEAEPAQAIAEIANNRIAPLSVLGTNFTWASESRPGENIIEFKEGDTHWDRVQVSLLGEHQSRNAAVAMATIMRLCERGWELSEKHVRDGLAKTRWPGRFQVVQTHPTVVVDCAHNTASMAALAQTLSTNFPGRRFRLVFAASSDKDVRGMLEIIKDHICHITCTRYLKNPRAVPPSQLVALAGEFVAIPCIVREDPCEALWDAIRLAEGDDVVVVAGSVFLVGEVIGLFAGSHQNLQA